MRLGRHLPCGVLIALMPTREARHMQVAFEQGNFEDAKKVRIAVFMEEQGFRNEFEDADADARMIHVTAYVDGVLAGCSRVFPAELEPALASAPGRWVFGRLCVLPQFRKRGLGSAILRESERIACEKGATEMHLHAQCAAARFYEQAGYAVYGPVEYDEHVEHQWYKKRLA